MPLLPEVSPVGSPTEPGEGFEDVYGMSPSDDDRLEQPPPPSDGGGTADVIGGLANAADAAGSIFDGLGCITEGCGCLSAVLLALVLTGSALAIWGR